MTVAPKPRSHRRLCRWAIGRQSICGRAGQQVGDVIWAAGDRRVIRRARQRQQHAGLRDGARLRSRHRRRLGRRRRRPPPARQAEQHAEKADSYTGVRLPTCHDGETAKNENSSEMRARRRRIPAGSRNTICEHWEYINMRLASFANGLAAAAGVACLILGCAGGEVGGARARRHRGLGRHRLGRIGHRGRDGVGRHERRRRRFGARWIGINRRCDGGFGRTRQHRRPG